MPLGPDLRRRAASWGTRPAEETVALPCDALLPGAGLVLHRAVGVAAPAPLAFRGLCRLRAAPYSYDVLDDAGRRSPQELPPGRSRPHATRRRPDANYTDRR